MTVERRRWYSMIPVEAVALLAAGALVGGVFLGRYATPRPPANIYSSWVVDNENTPQGAGILPGQSAHIDLFVGDGRLIFGTFRYRGCQRGQWPKQPYWPPCKGRDRRVNGE